MALLAVQAEGAAVGIHGERVEVRRGAELLHDRPLHEVSALHLYGPITVSGAAVQALLKAGVDVVWLSRHGRLLGRCVARESATGERRVAQIRALSGPAGLVWAQGVVDAKLAAQRSLLLRLRRRQPAPALTEGIVALRRLRDELTGVGAVAEAMGVEGLGAALYLRGLAAAVGPEAMRFSRRSRRPPEDPFNACLSFGYTLLLVQVEAAVDRVGLDRHVGGLHSPGRGKPALALDVMEPLRPWVDRLVLTLVNRRQLQAEDFAPVEGGVHLAARGRAVFLRAFHQAWRGALPHPEDGRLLGTDAWLEDRLYALGRWCAGEGAPPSLAVGDL